MDDVLRRRVIHQLKYAAIVFSRLAVYSPKEERVLILKESHKFEDLAQEVEKDGREE